jgi:hypothetical protein
MSRRPGKLYMALKATGDTMLGGIFTQSGAGADAADASLADSEPEDTPVDPDPTDLTIEELPDDLGPPPDTIQPDTAADARTDGQDILAGAGMAGMKGQLDVHHNRLDEHDHRLKKLEEDDVHVGDDYSAAPADDEDAGTLTRIDEDVMGASSEAPSSVISVAGGQLVL